MNIDLPYIPQRQEKPRKKGLTMVIDKGLTTVEAQGLADSCKEHIDIIKFGFGTALVTPNIKNKISIYKQAGIIPYCGGSLFELFIIRNKFEAFKTFIKDLELEYVEVSDGSISISHSDKLKYIEDLSKEFTVLSEVGYKTTDRELSDDEWVHMMKTELNAGSWKVIGEARESGTIGLYNADGSSNKILIGKILDNISSSDIIWEAPLKAQQVMFIKLLGANVNLGNIPTNETIALETLRLGLRGDTFFDNLPKK